MSEFFDDAPSPWWPCPECGGIEFRTVVMFERGRFTDDSDEFTETYEEFAPPDGRPSGVVASDVTCIGCGHRFDIHGHYGWPGAEEQS